MKIKWIVIIGLALLFSCDFDRNSTRSKGDDGSRDLEQIIADGVLTAVTEFNSTNYFIYKGEPMGYQFDMLQAFAEHLGVRLEIIAENNLEEAFKMLEEGEVDVFANNLTVTGTRSKKFSFTIPHSQTRQVLVQRKKVAEETGVEVIRNPIDLSNRIVYVQKGSASANRLRNLSDEIGTPIVIVEMSKYEADELIELVANSEIDYTVCDEDVAKVNANYFENIDIETPVSFEQNLAWAVGKDSPMLLNELNEWLEGFAKTAEYRIIRTKYFENSIWAKRIINELTAIRNGKISKFDDGFKNASNKIDWDWRLFASMVYQESRFKHNVKSNKGAYGLMQFMPSTAKYFGVKHKTDPDTQIEAGAKYLRWLDNRFIDSIPDPEERIKFILASYNAGLGHVIDARNLARKYGKNPNVWENNVDYFILNKSNPEFYKDDVVKHGYCRGEETYNYVTQIISRYKHYRNIIPN
ncbi:MAG TPA: transporter substrate-binding domain-containing protein [Tenuifilaceae bacterium]|nr:transporter substrate-binding domain-containing protein [Tenuifilaceae bacterium]HPE18954.1 transporter substrate-binding domain-containing protein [Tenuifilaceae bacterium]HPJ46411.1 transporter substrate-binding domain-containing protein [Tenuifilaceae bacterium]HPQ34598.1 transporter substrate-binding domain-containing protein [Tenuifilaceae bacterium]HRX67432.1 transporter substrate-binding domain-containing protein [Tenuifilaceae bacterium]